MEKKEYGPLIIGKLMNIGAILERKGNQLLAPFDLNQQQFSILFEIGRTDGTSQKTMVNRLMLEKAHVSKVVKKLAGMNLIEVTESPSDKRSSLLKVTAKGRKTIKECSKIFGDWNSKWIEELDPEKHEGLLEGLTELQNILKSMNG